MKMIVDAPGEQVDLELVALGTNLALNNKCALQIVEYGKRKGLRLLIKRAFKFKDALCMKMIRNLSQHDEVKKHFAVSQSNNSSCHSSFSFFISLIFAKTSRLGIRGSAWQDNTRGEQRGVPHRGGRHARQLEPERNRLRNAPQRVPARRLDQDDAPAWCVYFKRI